MNKQHLRRPRIQRAFDDWINKNRTRFSIPICVTRTNGKGIKLFFQNYPDCLSVWLGQSELSVHVNWQEHWDMLINLDAYVKPTHVGYQCELCLAEHGSSARTFTSKEALWQDHLFEPFLQWVNKELAPANWLLISGTDDGSTATRLMCDKGELNKSDLGLIVMHSLRCINGTRFYYGAEEDLTEWLIELRTEMQ